MRLLGATPFPPPTCRCLAPAASDVRSLGRRHAARLRTVSSLWGGLLKEASLQPPPISPTCLPRLMQQPCDRLFSGPSHLHLSIGFTGVSVAPRVAP